MTVPAARSGAPSEIEMADSQPIDLVVEPAVNGESPSGGVRKVRDMKSAGRLLVVGAVALVAACGGGGGGGSNSSSGTPPSINPPPTTPTDPLNPPTRGEPTLYPWTNAQSAGIELVYAGGSTALVQPPEVRVRRLSNGGFEFDLGGVTHTFAATDCIFTNGCTVNVDPSPNTFNDEYDLFIRTGTLDELLAPGSDWHEIVVVQSTVVNNGIPALRAFGIIGSPTTGIQLPQVGTATYSGTAFAEIFPANGYVNNFTSRTELRSRLDMAVNFENSKISGALSGIEERYPTGVEANPSTPWESINGTWRMTETDLSVNGFTGKIVPDANYNGALNLTSSAYAGAFYGPNADEVGGTLSLTGTAAAPAGGGDFNGIGYFTGTKD
jgi:hypothetical protein